MSRPRRRTGPPAATEDFGTGVSLPTSLVDRLRDYAKAQGRTYTDITLDAVEATHERLAELLAPVQRPRSGPLFSGRPTRRTSHGEAHVQVNLRFGAEDLAVIDRLWPAVGAASRSSMLAAALDEYLPPDETPEGRTAL